jgi:Fic family protein
MALTTTMANVTPQAEKLFNALKQAGAIGEEKPISAEKATSLSKLPKAQCMNAIQELEKKGIMKVKKKNNAVSYYLAKTELP